MIVPKKKKVYKKGEAPNTVVDAEAWMFQNLEILASIKRGFDDAVEGRVSRINLDTL